MPKESFDAVKVFFGVDADGVVVGGLDVDVEAVFEEPELLQALGAFEWAGRQGREALERGLAIGIEADVLPVGAARCRRGRREWWRGRSRARGRPRR